MSTQLLGDVQLPTVQEVEAMIEAVVVPETTIDDKISSVETRINNVINQTKENIDSSIELTNSSINAEKARAQAQETILDDMVKDEAELRETTDDALHSRIEREEGVRETADNHIIELVNAEKTSREASDITLQQNIEELSNKINPSVSQLTELIASEEQARINADNVLTADILKNKQDISALKETINNNFEDTIFAARLTNLPIAQITVENNDKTIAVGDTLGSVSSKYLPLIPVTFSLVSVIDDSGTDKYAYLTCRLDANGNITVINKSVLSETFEGNINSVTVMYITKE